MFTIRCSSFTCRGTKRNLLNVFPQAQGLKCACVVHMVFSVSVSPHVCECVRAEIALMCRVSLRCCIRWQISTMEGTPKFQEHIEPRVCSEKSNEIHPRELCSPCPHYIMLTDPMTCATRNEETKKAWSDREFSERDMIACFFILELCPFCNKSSLFFRVLTCKAMWFCTVVQLYEIYLHGLCLPYLISLELFQLFQLEYQEMTSSCTEKCFLFAATTSSRRLKLELGLSMKLQRDQRLKQTVKGEGVMADWAGEEELTHFTVGWGWNS